MSKKIKKAHLKDVDFHTREQRSFEWERDFAYWVRDLERHKDSVAVQVQLPLLYEIMDIMLNEPDEAEQFVIDKHALADTSTDEGLAQMRLCSSVLWYLQPK